MTSTIRISGDRQREYACQRVREAPLGYTVKIAEETRRDAQNRLLWPLLADIQRQVDTDGVWTAEQWKLRFLNALDNEMMMLPRIDGQGGFVVGQRSSQLSVQMFSNLIELIFKYGAEKGVQWSRKSQDVISNEREPCANI